MTLSKRSAFLLQASLMVSFLAGSSAATPLYAHYQAAWGFSAIAVTFVFGIYAVGVLAMLLVTGALSDYIGRRPVLFVTTALQIVAMVLFARANGLGDLVAARVVQGLATGAAASAVGAGLLDIDRTRGTMANALTPMLGTGAGSLLSGLLVTYVPWPTLTVYVVLGLVYVAQLVGIAVMPESVPRRPGALASLRPQFRLPEAVRRPLALAIPALVAAWAFIGFYASLGPSLVRRLADTRSPLLGGITLFVLAASGATTVFLLRDRTARTFMLVGTAALATGTGVTLYALDHFSLALFYVACVMAGAGFGASFQGAIRSVVGVTDARERAGVLSVLYVVAYLAMGLPAIAGGVRVVHGGGLITTAREYGLAVMALAAMAFLGTIYRTTVKSNIAKTTGNAIAPARSSFR